MPSTEPIPSSSTTTLTKEHIFYCFDVLSAELAGLDTPAADAALPGGEESFPLFVTWNIYSSATSSGTPRLRGCIGTFEPMALRDGLAEYAFISAFKDHRFNPITKAELSRLECGVSLLTNFEECSDYLDWELGVHGIYIDFKAPSSTAVSSNTSRRLNGTTRTKLTATYLPEVAPAQGWTKMEAIDSAIQKAGWNGPVTEDLRQSLHVRRYRSEKDAARYSAWKAARGTVGAS